MSVKCLIYCSKAKPYLYKTNFVKLEDIKKGYLDKLVYEIDKDERLYLNGDKRENLNGKIVAEIEIDKVEEIILNGDEIKCKYGTRSLFSIEEESCLTFDELDYYLNVDKPYGYALHLTNLNVFDRPLSFDKDYIYKDYKTNELIEKAPQNMCNVYDRFGNHYILISIKPKWVAKILNGEKTIEVRKQIINVLKELI